MQEMIKNGIIFQGQFLPCFSHNQSDLRKINKAFEKSSEIYKLALEKGIKKYLIGEPIKNVFRKYN